MRSKYWLTLSLLLGLLMAGCSTSSPSIQVEGAWARPAQAGANSAAYFVLTNLAEDDVLLAADSPIASQAQIHATVIDENGTASMQLQEEVEVPAGAVITFRPGGLHVMLLGLTTDFLQGDTIQITLIFENYGELAIDVPIENN
jgi:copper(I)-binding protein